MARIAPAMILLLLAGCSEPGAESQAEPRPAHDWVVLYYLPYDNDLSRFASPILDDLEAGIGDDRLAVAAYVDRAGVGGSEHVSLTSAGRETNALESESSADPATFAAFLDWAVRAHPSRRYALFLLGHGGSLDQFALDQLPETNGPRWLTFSRAAEVIAAWGSEHDTNLDVLFLQQCGRGTAETYYQLRDAADVLVASQVNVGVPNSYYVDMGRMLSTYPDATGERLARFAVGWERDSMFYEYSIVKADSLDALPARLDAALEGVDSGSLVLTGLRPDDGYVDLPRWVAAVRRGQGLDEGPADELAAWIEDDVVLYRRLSARSDTRLRGASGLSVFVPRTAAELDRHAALSLYAASELDEVHRRQLGSPSGSAP